MKYLHLATRLYNTPLMLHPDRAAVIEGVLKSRMTGATEAPPGAEAEHDSAIRTHAGLASTLFQRRPDLPYSLTSSGVAVIPIVGTLIQRGGGMLNAMSGLIGYNQIEYQLATAYDDKDTKAVLLEIDSPGGEVNGNFDLASKILAARGVKPIWAHANEQAYSAAYALACAAERVVVAPTGGVGSIGVIALHVDQSQRDAAQGYTYTAIHAGARKNDYTPHAPLSQAARSSLQGEVDRLYGVFVAHVARARGLSREAVRATEAGLLNPQAALAGRFVDRVAGIAETLHELEGRLSAG